MTTDKARAEACLNELQDLLGRIHNPGAEEAAQQIIEKHLTSRDAEAAAKLARVEAALVKWQHEAEGLREAVRVLGAECAEHRWHVDPGHREGTDAAIRRTDANPIAKAAIDAAGGA